MIRRQFWPLNDNDNDDSIHDCYMSIAGTWNWGELLFTCIITTFIT